MAASAAGGGLTGTCFDKVGPPAVAAEDQGPSKAEALRAQRTLIQFRLRKWEKCAAPTPRARRRLAPPIPRAPQGL